MSTCCCQNPPERPTPDGAVVLSSRCQTHGEEADPVAWGLPAKTATSQSTSAYCPRCKHEVGSIAVTPDGRHSRAAGGCGSKVTGQETRFYVHRGEQYLASDRETWTGSLDTAWHTTDRTEAGSVAREHNAKALPVKVPA